MRNSANQSTDLDFTRLPSAPHVLVKLIDLCHQPEVSIEALENVISQDTALTGKVISLSNSAAYSQWNEVRDLKRILVVLGTNTIKSIALTSAVHQFFSQFSRELGETLGSIWLDALICAHLSRKLASLTAYPYPDEAHLAGLIHQLGQLVLLSNDPENYQAMLASVPDQSALLFEEKQRYGINSADLGADIVRQWGIEGALSDAIRYQHCTAELLQDTDQLVRLTSLASQLCNRLNHTQNKYLVEDTFFGLNQPMIDNLVLESTSLAVADARGFGIDVDEDHSIPRANIDDEAIRIELARRMRDIALLQGLHGDEAINDFSSLLQVVTNNLQLVFSLRHALFFFPDAAQSQLIGVANHSKLMPANGSFQVALRHGRSLVADAALEATPLFSLGQQRFTELPVVDRQIISTLKAPQVVCLPLIYSGKILGVIVIGCEDYQSEQLQRNVQPLLNFATVVAEAFSRHKRITRAHQAQLEQQKLERDVRTRKVVHEVNNPLSVINNYLELLSMQIQSDDDSRQHLDTIKTEVSRMSKILLQLKDDQAEGMTDQALVDINDLVGRMVEIFKLTLFRLKRIDCELKLDPNMDRINTDQDKVKQILTNLIKNAAEALQERGRIQIRTRSLVKINQQDYIEISIADNGPGLPSMIVDNMFTPVETTKGSEHTGLGLTIVGKLVKELLGLISYTTADQGGAEFVILLPRKQV
jgi:HD-like signal output (HDOD) protein/nitrogen-specific signal transduction histidine kinase